jgi:hypothetical protein
MENGVEGVVSRPGNAAQLFGVDEGIGRAGLVAVKVGGEWVFGRRGSRLRLGGPGCAGLGFDVGTWLGGFGLLLPAAPLRDVDLRGGRGGGLGPRWGEAAVGDQAFDGYDHGKGVDLAGHAASGGFRVEIGQFPEPGQDLVTTKVKIAQPLGFLVHQFFPDGGAVLVHVGADAGLGFGVGSGVGIETDGFRGAAVIHGSGEDQVNIGHFLIGDEIGDGFFGHSESLSRLQEMGRAVVSHPSPKAAKDGAPEHLIAGWCWWICGRDRVWYRTAVKLSFARA